MKMKNIVVRGFIVALVTMGFHVHGAYDDQSDQKSLKVSDSDKLNVQAQGLSSDLDEQAQKFKRWILEHPRKAKKVLLGVGLAALGLGVGSHYWGSESERDQDAAPIDIQHAGLRGELDPEQVHSGFVSKGGKLYLKVGSSDDQKSVVGNLANQRSVELFPVKDRYAQQEIARIKYRQSHMSPMINQLNR